MVKCPYVTDYGTPVGVTQGVTVCVRSTRPVPSRPVPSQLSNPRRLKVSIRVACDTGSFNSSRSHTQRRWVVTDG